jgi:threonyl-tRNA synthetase
MNGLSSINENLKKKISSNKNFKESNLIAVKCQNKFFDVRDDIQDLDEQNYELITYQSPEAIEILRHDLAHIMAQAVQELYPNSELKLAIGPTIEYGFYYDFDLNKTITIEDLERIEEKMREIQKRRLPIIKYELPRNEAIEFFKKLNETYKVELISSIPENETITLYQQGDFIDLCRGPHSLNTQFSCAFKLTKISGAYWKGSSENKMLQRVYAVAFVDKNSLKDHLNMLKEAEARDHRKLGKELGLFHLQDEAHGQVFWHENGYIIYNVIENYIRNKLKNNGYIEVKTPLLADKSLWEKSGHWEKFHDNMFIVEQKEKDSKMFAIKPMNCPMHIQIFKQNLHSYKNLPLRMAEFGCCHRHESSGALHGIMRVLSFTQDDAHIFCTEDQINDEIIRFCELLKDVYQDFGFTNIKVKLSDRPEKRAGSDEIWDKSEKALEDAVINAKLPYTINKGEGAFYGPKLEFVLEDAIKREWQCGTIQVDFVLPERLNANYIDRNGEKQKPVMLHRAIIGTFERFIGIIIENYAGKFPFWLAPVQIMIVNITDSINEYAIKIFDECKRKNFRVKIDLENHKLSYKLKKYSDLKIPVICIIGHEEKEENSVSLRFFGDNKQQKCSVDKLEETLKNNFMYLDINNKW